MPPSQRTVTPGCGAAPRPSPLPATTHRIRGITVIEDLLVLIIIHRDTIPTTMGSWARAWGGHTQTGGGDAHLVTIICRQMTVLGPHIRTLAGSTLDRTAQARRCRRAITGTGTETETGMTAGTTTTADKSSQACSWFVRYHFAEESYTGRLGSDITAVLLQCLKFRIFLISIYFAALIPNA